MAAWFFRWPLFVDRTFQDQFVDPNLGDVDPRDGFFEIRFPGILQPVQLGQEVVKFFNTGAIQKSKANGVVVGNPNLQ